MTDCRSVPLLAGNPMVDPRVIDGGCDNTIDEFAALIERADLVVTPDSLAFHLATALHRPIVVIVGPTSPWELELYGRGEAISADVPCIACYRRACQKPVTCMDLLRPEHVYSACERVRGASPALQWCLLDERNHPD